jgi:hypothetical protein
MVIATKFTSG